MLSTVNTIPKNRECPCPCLLTLRLANKIYIEEQYIEMEKLQRKNINIGDHNNITSHHYTNNANNNNSNKNNNNRNDNNKNNANYSDDGDIWSEPLIAKIIQQEIHPQSPIFLSSGIGIYVYIT